MSLTTMHRVDRDAAPGHVATRRVTGALRILALTCAVGLLTGCAAEPKAPDPDETRESLQQVSEDPEPSEAEQELDAETHPEPTVEARDCTPYLVITLRGTGEPEKKQLLSTVVKTISKARPDEVDHFDIDYAADSDIKEGGTRGARTLIDTLNVQTESCPDQRFLLLGYSQGALVLGDALSSPDVRLVGDSVGEITSDAVRRVLAIVLYGNPRFVGSEPFDAGDYDPQTNGIVPRPPGSLAAFADRIRDYCVATDFVCQSSLDLDEQGHVSYFSNGMREDGAAFAISQLDPAGATPAR